MTLPDIARDPAIQDLVRRALEEDIGGGDVTTKALVPADRVVNAVLIARTACTVAGTGIAELVYRAVDPALRITIRCTDGATVAPGTIILQVRGPARAILTAERTALNFMQRMCGIATLTHAFVERVRPHKTVILDTRKTTPTLRVIEKYAVLCGGGTNHRMGLYDMALIKDNHRHLWAEDGRGDLSAAVAAVRRAFPGLPVEVEVESEAELESALRGPGAPPEWILLDNMEPELMRRCVEIGRGRCRFEASGGITLETAAAVAATGVNAISLGCLTHSAAAADLSLELTP